MCKTSSIIVYADWNWSYSLWSLKHFFLQYTYLNQCQQHFTSSKKSCFYFLVGFMNKRGVILSAPRFALLLSFHNFFSFFSGGVGVGCLGGGALQCETVISSANWAELVLGMILSLVKFSLKYQPNYWIFSSVNSLSEHLDKCLLPLLYELNALLSLITI